MRYRVVILLMLWCAATAAPAQLSIGIGLPGVNIGINLPVFPELVPVPDYPVYYAPRSEGKGPPREPRAEQGQEKEHEKK